MPISIPEALWKAANFRINFLTGEREELIRRLELSHSPEYRRMIEDCDAEIRALYDALSPSET